MSETNADDNSSGLSPKFGPNSKEGLLEDSKHLDKVNVRDYVDLLDQLEKAVLVSDSPNCIHICQHIVDLSRSINKKTLIDYCSSSGDSCNFTNFVILACKHGKIELLDYILSKETNIQIGELVILPSDRDAQDNHAFYYAMRWTEIKLLDTLIHKWPGKYFDKNPEELDQLLSDAYCGLKLKNVALSMKMVGYVESVLVKLRFFVTQTTHSSEPAKEGRKKTQNSRKKKPQEKKVPQETLQRIDIVLDKIKFLQSKYLDAEADEIFVCVVKLIAKCLHVLKRQLKATYNKIPWEEIEFYLTAFIKSFETPEEEVNLFYSTILKAQKILVMLKNFAYCLSDVKINIDFQVIGSFSGLKRPEMIKQVIKQSPFTKEFYEDYEDLRDFYSLGSISKYLNLASTVDATDKYGQLIIIRALQVVGEHMKNTVECPKLSSSTNLILLTAVSSHTGEVLKNLRDSLSHDDSLAIRMEIEENTVSFFTEIQNDLKKLSAAVTEIVFEKKNARICSILENIICCEKTEKMMGLLDAKGVAKLDSFILEVPARREMEKLEVLIKKLERQIGKKTRYEQSLFDEIDNAIRSEKSLSDFGNNVIKGTYLLKGIKKMIASGCKVSEVKVIAREALLKLSLRGGRKSLKNIADLCSRIWGSIETRIGDKHDEVKYTIWQIYYIYEDEVGKVNWIEDLQKQLKPPSLKRKKKSSEMLDMHKNMLQPMIQMLKVFFPNIAIKQDRLDQSITSYEDNEKLKALVEMLLLDIITILSSIGRLSDNPYFLDCKCPMLLGKNLRNHLAHENALVNVLSSTSLNIFLTATAIADGILKSCDAKLDKIIVNEPSKMKDVCDQELRTLCIQQKLFISLTDGDISSAKRCIMDGADLKGRDINQWTALHFAAKGSVTETVKFIIDHDTYINLESVDMRGQNVLHVAAQFGRTSVLEYFIDDKRMSVDRVDGEKRTPLHLAAEKGHCDVVESLLSRGARTNTKDVTNHSPLHRAVLNNYVEVTNILLNEEWNVDANEADGGVTALHIAAQHGYLDMVDVLIDRGAEINLRTDRGFTPLLEATLNGNLQVVERLIERGALVTAKDVDGLTPLHVATKYGWEDLVKVLIGHGAEVNASTYFAQQTPLHCAAKSGYTGIVILLLHRGANPNVRWIKGLTPLHLAAMEGHYDVVRRLVESKASVDASDDEMYTSLHYAALRGENNIVGFLIQEGANVNSMNEFGFTALHFAAQKGHKEVLEILISKRADIDAKNDSGLTALHMSSFYGNQEIVELLMNSANMEDDADYTKIANTPPIAAILGDHKEILELFIEKEAYIRNELLFYACDGGNPEIVQYLILKGFEINGYHLGSTPLHWAVQNNQKEVAELLLIEGADINAKDEDTKTALYYAVDNNCKDIVVLLTSREAEIDFELLYLAIHFSCIDIVDSLLRKCDFDVNTPHKMGEFSEIETTLLLTAADKGYLSIVETLLGKGAKINVTPQGNVTPLIRAAAEGHLNLVSLFISKDADVNLLGANGVTALHAAASAGSVAIVELLLNAGADPTLREIGNKSPIEYAAIKGHVNVVDSLIKKTGFDINSTSDDGMTLLHYAALSAELNMVKYLLKHSADPHVVGAEGHLAIQLAALKGQKDIVEYLLNGHNKIDELGFQDNTLLHYAAIGGWSELTKFLISRNASVDAPNSVGSTPMHIAAMWGRENVIRVLVESGGCYDILDKSGRTPLQVENKCDFSDTLSTITELFSALKRHNLPKVKACVGRGALVNAKASNGVTCLHYVCWKGYEDIVNLLLENKANPNAVDKFGGTPLHYATKYSHINVVMTLLARGAVYDARSKLGKTPFEYACRPSVIAKLLDLIDRSFTAVQNGDSSILNELKYQDLDTVKAVVRSRNSEEKSLVVVAILNKFSGLEEIKRLLQNDILHFTQSATNECINTTNEGSDLFPKAILLRRIEVFGPDDPSTLDARENMARFLVKTLNYDAALTEFQDIYKKREEAFGQHKDTLKTKSNIAFVLQKMGQYRESLKMYQEIIPLQISLLGRTHARVLSNQMNMVLLLCALEEIEEALELNTEINECMREYQDIDDAVYLEAQTTNAEVMHSFGKYDQALEVLWRVYNKRMEVLESDHADTLNTLQGIARILQEQEKYEQALEIYWKVLGIQKSSVYRNQLDELITKKNIGNIFYAQGRFLEAYKMFRDVLDPMAANLKHSQPDISGVLQKMKKIEMKYEFVYRDGSRILRQNVKTDSLLRRDFEDLMHADEEGGTALHYFVHAGDEESVRFLLLRGLDVFQASNKGYTSLHIAAGKGLEGMVIFLLQHVKEVHPFRFQDFIDAKTFSTGDTALHVAASVRVTRLLLVHGATYDLRNAAGESPLEVAEDKNKSDLLHLVDECFNMVERDFLHRLKKLKDIRQDDFLAVTRARNRQGNTLYEAAAPLKSGINYSGESRDVPPEAGSNS